MPDCKHHCLSLVSLRLMFLVNPTQCLSYDLSDGQSICWDLPPWSCYYFYSHVLSEWLITTSGKHRFPCFYFTVPIHFYTFFHVEHLLNWWLAPYYLFNTKKTKGNWQNRYTFHFILFSDVWLEHGQEIDEMLYIYWVNK